ncbi:hypothetical protein [Clostridium sp.]|uniref:hypothetical protein n=1 Tax=Clostridium sp. TaxID=1506 RepID=UPI002609A02D|nr:hypothetical protein [Clostridium sp.]
MKNPFNNSNLKNLFKYSLYPLLSLILILNFVILISKTPKNSTFTLTQDEPVYEVNSFLTDNSANVNLESSILNYLNNLYSLRNDSIFTGDVKELYNYYNINTNFGAYSLEHEFKRIAFLRDFSRSKDVTFISFTSIPTINSLKEKNSIINLTFNEEFSFEYYYNKDPKTIKSFKVNLVHTLELEKDHNTYLVNKDYYIDFFKNGLDKYKFTLKETKIP